MVNYSLMLIVALIVGYVVYMQVQKAVAKTDVLDSEINSEKYLIFCDTIDENINLLKNYPLKDENLKDEYLQKISNLGRELTFIRTMHQTNLNDEIWQRKLCDFLEKFDETIEIYLQDGQKISDEVRENLAQKFNLACKMG